MACVMPWSGEKTFAVGIREPLTLTGELTYGAAQGAVKVGYKLPATTIPLKISPAPNAYLAGNAEFALKCHAAWMASAATLALSPMVEPLRGNIDLQLKELRGEFSLQLPKLEVPEVLLLTKPSIAVTTSAMYLGGELHPSPKKKKVSR